MSETVVEIKEVVEVPDKKITVTDLLETSNLIQEKCFDFDVTKVSNSNFRFDPTIGTIKYVPDRFQDMREKVMSKHAMNQLCTKIGVPVRYMEKCISEGHIGLAATNINAWVDQYGRNLFIREYGDRIRAVLSDRYMVLDTPVILDSLVSLIDPDEFSVKGYFISEERFHARIVLNEMLKISGEDLFAGIQVDSSDVGRSMINIQFLVYKQVCTNGLIVAHADFELFKKRHLGASQVNFEEEFQEAFNRLPELIDTVPQMVKTANQFDNAYDMSELVIEDTERKPTRVERILRDRHRFSNKEVNTVLEVMKRGDYPVSRWGFVNSITDAAKQFTLERRLEMEKVAGQILLAA